MESLLSGQTAVITGGTQGIGWALTQALAAHGAQVYACGYSADNLERAENERQTLPWREQISLARCDVTDREQYVGWLEEVHGGNGRLDILIHNAAYVQWDDVLNMSIDQAQHTMRVGYDGMVTGIRTALPWMMAAGQGHIVTVGSITARILVRGSSAAYTATKAAIDAYTITLQIELAHTPVSATLVRLGTVAGTDFFKKHVQPGRTPKLNKYLPALTPPQVATAVLRAMQKKQPILTLPRYLGPLSVIYQIAPRFSRWLSDQGWGEHPDYGRVDWTYKE
ncbi:MAG: SDR family oxidoreductase [Chloroflexi bacterium]|nr:SDR family oxidoreductase [Chloroflexota bacterium]MBP7590159.1 SDR family oxidoreductase [Chloroflexota bacterium]